MGDTGRHGQVDILDLYDILCVSPLRPEGLPIKEEGRKTVHLFEIVVLTSQDLQTTITMAEYKLDLKTFMQILSM